MFNFVDFLFLQHLDTIWKKNTCSRLCPPFNTIDLSSLQIYMCVYLSITYGTLKVKPHLMIAKPRNLTA